ncbi:hypothetical protein BATDEDRAFT_23114 [Batrachochytrium dendrobatidis JAM81]|uniref:Uncharacterized protein n=1 Tax=Batrachochytrium dendrobatidis (strain JAM81 / FGSC 10211) TaxID=684364 RepID=F4NWS1_BATDJ|nr:uncharacterized protein BATDEDRAFT_23114 [Batrachochytrium dendrobatidis JAM81]EGF82872.1 hypothetical protein BATDEDRAFT_23114 [Batrachochytrium dendrobatidis JAM81]|eukprot:XP_006676707.1 hypothetical protein BATDEDRAFT_23114 [Batrachochytrium dendrobatidis JAM81]
MKFYWNYVVTPVVINILAAIIRVSLISFSWNLMSWWARRFGVIRMTASFHLAPFRTVMTLLTRGRSLFTSPYANEKVHSEMERRRRKLREKPSAAKTTAAIGGTICLLIISICAQATDVLFSKFIKTDQGLYPRAIVDPSIAGNMSFTVPSIGINLTYSELRDYCNPKTGILVCPTVGPWWDNSYALMISTSLLNSTAPATIAPVDIRNNFVWNVTGLTMRSITLNSVTYQIPQCSLAAIQTTVNSSFGALQEMPIEIPLVDSHGILPISPTSIFQQQIWTSAVNTTGNNSTPMIAESKVDFDFPFDNGTFGEDPAMFFGFGASQSGKNIANWNSMLIQQTNLIGPAVVLRPGNTSQVKVSPYAPQSLSSQNTTFNSSVASGNNTAGATWLNATAYGGALCAKANLRNGSTYEMIFIMASNTTGVTVNPASTLPSNTLHYLRGMVWDINNVGANPSPMYIISKSILFTEVMPCRIYDAGLGIDYATNSFTYLISRCTVSGLCRSPTIISVPRTLQPILSYNFAPTIYNMRNATVAADNGTSLQQQTAFNFYIRYTSTTGANVHLAQLWMHEPEQTMPGVCSATSQCDGSILPVWVGIVIIILLILTEVSSQLIEELLDIIIFGFLSTTGPYLLSLGPAVFSYDSIFLSILTNTKAYVGVQPVGQYTASFHVVHEGIMGDGLSKANSKSIDHLSNPNSRRPLVIYRVKDAVKLAEKDKVQLKV